MSSSDLYYSFDFIFETAKKISDELNKDGSNDEWMEQAREEYNNNLAYPDDTYDRIRNAIQKNDQLYEHFVGIVSNNEDSIEQFYNSIFFSQDDENIQMPQGGEEEEEEEVIFDPDDSQPETVATALTPELLEQRQQKQINQISTTLYISTDLSYLLLKKFNWNSDRLMSCWVENEEAKKNLLDSLHITESMVREPLSFKNVGKGECEVCCEDGDLYQMYCGHILCGPCWTGEIEAQISQGVSSIVCRIDDCGAEIMLSDVAKFCGAEKADAYKKFILEDQISRDNKLIHCSGVNCNQVLTIDSVGLCGVATCTCGKRICWKCQKDAHAPLTCEQLEEWAKIRDEMTRLSRAQSRWERRELSLMDYRRSHLSEVQKVNKDYNDQLKLEHDIQNTNEIKEINRMKEELKKITDEKLRQVKASKIREKQNENKIKQQDRKREREQIINEQNSFISAIQSPNNAKFYFHQLNESQELRAMEKYCTTDEEFIERMTKKCPKCKTPIQKNGGCNYMKCARCGFEFCWLCGADWKTHGDHFSCNKYDGKIGNVEDDEGNLDNGDDEEWMKNDNKKYYLPPMNSELRGKFARWNHYYRRYQAHLDAQRMEKRNREQFRQTLVHSWLDTMSPTTANKLVDKVYHTIDVARSVLIYSYPTAYFMDMHSKTFFMFEMCQSNLEITNEKLVGMVERFSGQKPEEFEKFAELNDKYIDATLREVDNYT